MASYEYVESAIIFNLDTKTNLRSFKHTAKDFGKHADAYKFVVSFFDDYGEFPSPELLCENFPTLDQTAQSLNFDYALETFKDQVLQRKLLQAFQAQRDTILINAKQALSNLLVDLTDIEVEVDEDVIAYDMGNLERLEEWRERTEKRKMGDGLMGIPTSFKSVNQSGVGWMPGELIAMFARPSVGKTWLCVHTAAVAVKNGFRTLFISTEMPSSTINMRLDVVLANMMGYKISHTALRRGEALDEKQYAKFLEETNNNSLLICDHIAGRVGMSLESIASLIRKHNPEFVVIDGVYLISTSDNKKAMWEQSHTLFYGLKNLATSTNTPIVVSTQANREAGNKFIAPKADQVAFGDALIRAADAVFGMALIEDYPDKRLIQFEKYRDGELPIDYTVMDWKIDSGEIVEVPNFEWGDF